MEEFREAKKQEKLQARLREEKCRAAVVVAGLLLLAAGIVGKLVLVQILEAPEYRKRAERQYEYKLPVKAHRGDIRDRNGKRLATSITVVSFAADPKMVEDADVLATAFAKAFGKPKAHYQNKLKEKTRFVWLERNVPQSIAKPIIEADFAGLIATKEVHRQYENLAAQVIGFTDADGNGISGLEKMLDKDLRGRDGFMMMQRTATGKSFPAVGAASAEAAHGNNVDLTLDADVQALVEDELQKGIERSGASAGIAIAMNTRTGEILAMANAPDFDMNDKASFSADAVRNRAVTDAFEPGSTFKLVMATAATELGLVKPNDKIYAENGRYRIKNRVITDHKKLGMVTFTEAVAHSSNVVAAKVGVKIGREKFYEQMKAFGFGEKTGVDVLGEISGNVKPTAAWSAISLPWMAHGYEVLVTPLQLLCAYAALANDGAYMQPFVIRKIISPTGEVLRENAPKVARQAMKRETAKQVRGYFKAVVDSGTGVSARIEGVSVGGKTGTAQLFTGGSYKSGRYVASFVGFFPSEQPEMAMLVMMINPTNGYYGSMAAAPVFSGIGSRMLATLGETYRTRFTRASKPSPEERFLDTVQTVVMPSVTGLTADEAKALLRLHKLDFGRENNLVDAKEQVVIWQSIEAGKRVAVWSKPLLRFSEASATESAAIETTKLPKMPMLIGLRGDRAIFAAANVGLNVHLLGKSGKVIAQSPKAGEPIKQGESCSLTLSN